MPDRNPPDRTHAVGYTEFTSNGVLVLEQPEQQGAEADSLHVFLADGARPRVARYWDALRARPSYEQGVAKHTHPTVTRGLERLRTAKRRDPALRAALETF